MMKCSLDYDLIFRPHPPGPCGRSKVLSQSATAVQQRSRMPGINRVEQNFCDDSVLLVDFGLIWVFVMYRFILMKIYANCNVLFSPKWWGMPACTLWGWLGG